MSLSLVFNQYIPYYEALEDDFKRTQKYVAFEEDNLKTFSTEYVKQYQAICSEIDVICKEIAGTLNEPRKDNINEYREVLLKFSPKIYEQRIILNEIELIPWKEFKSNKNPIWWKMYNGVKHGRTSVDENTETPYYKYANLENVALALSGLFILERYLYRALCDTINKTKVITMYPDSKVFDITRLTDHNINPCI